MLIANCSTAAFAKKMIAERAGIEREFGPLIEAISHLS
jgi:hypothetical protein